jgi:cobalt-zinc-cadmium efflux system protein
MDARRALGLSLALNLTYLVVELVAGLMTGSLALLSDAAHMVSDVAALSLALFAAQWARRPATRSHTYGLMRAEVLGAFVNAVVLLIACLFIFKEAAVRLVEGAPPVAGWPVFGVATVGLAVNLVSAGILWRSDRHAHGMNLNVRGALVHMLADALGSVGAMASALFTLYGDFPAADALASVVIGAMVLYGTWGILRDSTHVLLEAAPTHLRQDVIGGALQQLAGVASVHDVHVWTIGGGAVIATAHLGLTPEASPSDVLARAQALLRERFGLNHSTLQVEPAGGLTCRQVRCGLQADEPEPEHDHDHDHAHHGHGHGH